MLSQLSYRPDSIAPTGLSEFPRKSAADLPARLDEVVGLGRVELPTLPLSGARSSQLSYRPS
jgi:hypothetical protein